MKYSEAFGGWIPPRYRFPFALFVVLMYLPGLASADAQESADNAASRSSKDFELVLTVPFLYSSSVVRSDTDTAIGDAGDRHVDPDLALSWSRQFSNINLEAFVAATFERYATVREADVDRVTAGMKAELTDGRSDLFVPYFQYEHTVDYLPVFSITRILCAISQSALPAGSVSGGTGKLFHTAGPTDRELARLNSMRKAASDSPIRSS